MLSVLIMAVYPRCRRLPCHTTGGGANTMRLCHNTGISYSRPDIIREGITRLGLTLKEFIHELAGVGAKLKIL